MNEVIMRKARISEIHITDESRSLVVKTQDNGKEILTITENTKVFEDDFFLEKNLEDLEVGNPIYIYTKANSPMKLSNPPQYTPLMVIIAHNEDELFQVTDYFNEDLVNSGNTVKINPAKLEMIESISHDNLIKELLVDRQLVVFYHNSTRSIPAIIDPIKIIIL